MSHLTDAERAWIRWVCAALDHGRITGIARELALHSAGAKFHEPREKETQPFLEVRAAEPALVGGGYIALRRAVKLTHPGYLFIVTLGDTDKHATAGRAMSQAREVIANARQP